MMSERKHKYSVILNNYNKPSDRFLTSGYGDPSEQRGVYVLIDLAGKQGVVDGLEMLFDDSGEGGTWIGIGPSNKHEIKAALDKYGLELCSIIPNVWGNWHQAKGTIGSSNPAIRRASIDLCKRAIDVATDVGCPYIGIWPGQDGFDYYFEVDYQQVWDWWVEGVREIADHNPAIRIGLEPKPNEPRAYSFISTVPKTLLLIEDINRANVGVCLDIGHSLYGLENLAEVVALIQKRGNKLFHMHMNDNYRASDLDMMFGSVHTLEHVEMFYWLRRTGYDKFMSIDLFAYRTDPALSVAEGVKWMRTFDRFIDEVGLDALGALIKDGDPVKMSSFLREKIFGG
jgi:xylose isomerase